MECKIIVIGAVNMDIGGSPAGELIMRDSNPGSVTLRPGGVGRNIAHDLCLLGADVSLIAAIGGDVYGTAIMESCRAIGMDMSMALVLPERKSSTYLYVNDESGDMQIAISDMEITKCLGREHLEPLMEEINKANAVVIDANLEEDTIRYICENCTAPIYADPVSTVKAMKLHSVLDKIYGLKPNAIEAERLSGEAAPEEAAKSLVNMGVQRVFVSCGGDGMIIADKNGVISLPAVKTEVINTTGAGDAAAATIVMAGVLGKGIEESAKLAMQAGAMTCRCLEANNPAIAELLR